MATIHIKTNRFDPEINEPLNRIAKEFAKAFGYTSQTISFDPVLAQLIRLRVSQINHCTFCMYLHARVAREMGIAPEKVDTLSAWWETDLYSEAEEAALSYTEALTRQESAPYSNKFESIHQTLAANFSEKEISDIAAVVINMNVWTRLKMATGEMPSLVED